MAYDLSTDLGFVRFLISDDPTDPLFEDSEITGLLTRRDGHPKLVAADLLEIIARDELLLTKKIVSQDLSVDGPEVALGLREFAKRLREEDAQESAEGAGVDSWAFVVAEPPSSTSSYPELTGGGYWTEPELW